MGVPYTFSTASQSIPLAQLDSNFATPITIGSTTAQLGQTVTTITGLTLANVNITSGTISANSTSIQLFYPVGSIYTSTVNTNPNTLFGFGTWLEFAAGQVLIGNGGGFTAGNTGGSANAVVVSHTHTATVTDPGHAHNVVTAYNLDGSDSGFNYSSNNSNVNTHATNSASTGISVTNSTTGSSGTNANLPPYIVVYMWQRTA